MFVFCFAFLFFVMPFRVFSQKEQCLYLVMAFEDDYERHRDSDFLEYPKILYRLSSDTLAEVGILNADKGLKIERLAHYPRHRALYFSEKKLLDEGWGYEYISILDYENELTVRRFKPEWDTAFAGFTIGLSPVKVGERLMFNIERDRGADSYTDYGRDKFFNRHELAAEDFNQLVVEGQPGMSRTGPGSFAYRFVDGDCSQLKVGRKIGGRPMPDATIQIPDSLKICTDPFVWVVINNGKYFVGTQTVNYTDPRDTAKLLWIYDKKTSDWHMAHIPGLGSSVMNWRDWLYGTVAKSEYHLSKSSEYSNMLSQYHQQYGKRYNKEYGKAPNFALSTGQLFLYHIPSNTLMVWSTGEKDSEVLFIDKSTVYYRVFDEIRTVGLDESAKVLDWESDRLLVKDTDRVPHIHWMFMGPDVPLNEVWMNRPELKDAD